MANHEDKKSLIISEPLNVEVVKQKLSAEFPALFQSVRIFGTAEDPLFLAKDLEEILEYKHLHYDRDFELGTERVNIVINTVAGPKKATALTEHGLYRLLFKSNSDTAKKFRMFTTVVLKELRLRGQVTLADALQKLEGQLVEKHAQLTQAQKDAEKYYMKSFALTEEKEVLKIENQGIKRHLKAEYTGGLVQKIKQKCMKRVYLKLEKPPKEVTDEFEYDAKDEDVLDDEEYVFSLHFKEPEIQGCDAELYLFKDCKLPDIHKYLTDHGFGIKSDKLDGKNDGDRYYYNKYRATIELLSSAFDELIHDA